MDLPDLLAPERIRCRCDIQSKKRALQTVAELLGEALRAPSAERPPDGGAPPGDAPRTDNDPASASTGAPGADESGARLGGRMLGRRDKEARTHKERRAEKRGARRTSSDDASGISDMDILDALISRERLGSTGLGHGVALPHSRLDLIGAPLAAMITLKDGVDFDAADGEPVDLVLGLLVPQDCNDEHLKILANLARRFNDADLREALRGHESGEALFAYLQQLAAVAT